MSTSAEYVRWGDQWVPIEGIDTPRSVRQNLDTWWPMDDGAGATTITDVVGSRDLTVVGSPTLNADSITFSGTEGERLVDSNNAGAFYGGLSGISFFGWYNVGAGTGQSTMASLYDTTTDDRSWFFRIDWANNRVALNLSDDGINFGTQRWDGLPTTDQWVSLAYTADTATDDFTIYLNGTAQVTTESGAFGNIYQPAIDFWIGDAQYSAYPFNGSMRECGFAQSALDATTIQQIHNDTGPA